MRDVHSIRTGGDVATMRRRQLESTITEEYPVIRLLAVLFFTIASSMVLAAEPLDFYRATIPVRSQDVTERQYAAQKGLQEVLVRMSGSEDVLDNPEVQKAVDEAQRYIEQFQYQGNTNPELLKRGYREEMSMLFSSRVVERVLRQAGEPFWPVNRPSVLVWVVEDSAESGRQLVNRDNNPEVIESLEKSARKRGLPLVFPLLDLEDQSNLSADQLWSLNDDAIARASERYGADVVLVGKFSQTSRGEYWATWQYYYRGGSRVYDNRSENLDNLTLSGVTPLAEALARRYAIVARAESSPHIFLSLSGITGFGQYRQALDYLEGLAMVSGVSLLAVRQNTIFVSLKSDSSVTRFKNTLQLDRKLAPEEVSPTLTLALSSENQGSIENPLVYQWIAR